MRDHCSSVLESANRYADAGLSVFPIRADGSKTPASGALPKIEGKHPWKPYQTQHASTTQRLKWWKSQTLGIAIVCGAISHNLEVLDFDSVASYDAWVDLIDELAPGLRGLLPHVKTPAGHHHYYRCPTISGNLKLAEAMTASGKRGETLIETRGEGGYVIAPGSPLGCHPSKKPYTLLSGDLAQIPTITPEERALLHNAARVLTQYIPPVVPEQPSNNQHMGRISDEVQERMTWPEILEPHGWHRINMGRDGRSLWRRPGKDGPGISATTNHDGKDRLYVFSSNAAPFEPLRSYDKFGAYARLNYDGDFRAAVKGLVARGYGTSSNGRASTKAEKLDVSRAGKTTPPLSQDVSLQTSSDDRRPEEPDADPLPNGSASYIVRAVGPYALTSENRLTLHKTILDRPDDLVTIADFGAAITADVRSEYGERGFVVEGVTRDGHGFTLDISAQEFADDRSLKARLLAAAGHRATVRAGMIKHLGPCIQLLSPEDVPSIVRYDRTGWANGQFLIPGHLPNGVQLSLPQKLAYGIEAEASIEPALTALTALIESIGPERSTVVLAAAFQAPLAELAGWRDERYGLFLEGRSGSLKTSFVQVVMSLYGRGFLRDAAMLKWGEGATRNAIMALATHAADMPLMVDNFKANTGEGPRGFVNLVHALMEGSEKERLSRAAELRTSKPVYAWPLFTGESIADHDPASLARLLVVAMTWPPGEANPQLAAAQQSAHHLSAIGGSWLEWLQSGEGQECAGEAADLFHAFRAKWADLLRHVRRDMVNILRVASNLAGNELTWRVLAQHPILGPVAKRYQQDHANGLDLVASRMAQYTGESLEAYRYLQAVAGLIGGGQCVLRPYGDGPSNEAERDRLLGWEAPDKESVYLLPDQTMAAVTRLLGKDALSNVTANTLYAQLKGLKALASTGADHTPIKARTIKGKPPIRVLHLKVEALWPDLQD